MATDHAPLALGNESLYNQISHILQTARAKALQAVNSTMVQAYWTVGKLIVEAQGGDTKARYGDKLIDGIANRLTSEFGKGFDSSNLRNMRSFYLAFPICDTVCHKLSWSHYRLLMRIDDPAARKYYADEAEKSQWSVRQLKRQITTFHYERLLISQGDPKIKNEIYSLEPGKFEPEKIIRDPYVMEFIGIPQPASFSESDIEQKLIDNLQKFLLELGRGFSFVARQKRFTFDGRHFYIDLVFYNYIMKCFVLIDLKIGDLTHSDLGQMQMYVNYYERELMNEGDNPPIGIVLCADKCDAIVEYTLPKENNQIFASKYKLYLPTAEELRKEIAASFKSLRSE